MAPAPGNARSRRTREALLAAARDLIEHDGAAAATMGAVADRAGVTRRSIYLHFASRSELMGALFDHIAETEELQKSLAKVWAAPTAADALTCWAAHLARYHSRVLPVDRAIAQAAQTDPDAATHRARTQASKLDSCRRLAQRLHDEGALATGWTAATATDVLYALTTSDFVDGLLAERGWTQRRFTADVGHLLRAAFVGCEER